MEVVNREIKGRRVQIQVWMHGRTAHTAKAWLSEEACVGPHGGCTSGTVIQMGRLFTAEGETREAALAAVEAELDEAVIPA